MPSSSSSSFLTKSATASHASALSSTVIGACAPPGAFSASSTDARSTCSLAKPTPNRLCAMLESTHHGRSAPVIWQTECQCCTCRSSARTSCHCFAATCSFTASTRMVEAPGNASSDESARAGIEIEEFPSCCVLVDPCEESVVHTVRRPKNCL